MAYVKKNKNGFTFPTASSIIARLYREEQERLAEEERNNPKPKRKKKCQDPEEND